MKDFLYGVAAFGSVAWVVVGGFYFSMHPLGQSAILSDAALAQVAGVYGGFGTFFDTLSHLLPGYGSGHEDGFAVAQDSTQSPVAALPKCTLTVEPTVVEYGGSAKLAWTSQGADRAKLGGRDVMVYGSAVVNDITESRAFSLMVSKDGVASSCYAVVALNTSAPGMPLCEISVYPESVVKGESVEMAWWSQNADTVTLAGEGETSLSGGRTIYPQKTTSFTLNVGSKGGDSSCSTKVVVK